MTSRGVSSTKTPGTITCRNFTSSGDNWIEEECKRGGNLKVRGGLFSVAL